MCPVPPALRTPRTQTWSRRSRLTSPRVTARTPAYTAALISPTTTSLYLSRFKAAKGERIYLIPWSTLVAGQRRSACCLQDYTPWPTSTASAARTRSAGNMSTLSKTARSIRRVNSS
ncbi:Protein yippee-like protein [Hyalella azteca]|uniref:Protein yippee-like protein n=1 Tax=Hyalella azteca TaxID=294128 RepID=A0A6A0H7U0_HYAAZ|nr:Protein yippee-like protein [Hyalella azteca]